MNLLLRFLAVGSLLTAATTFAADAFEGQITLTMTQKSGKTQDMDMTLKGQRQRVDMTMAGGGDQRADGSMAGGRGGNVSMIMDYGKREMTILMAEQHMYMVRPMMDAGPTPAAQAKAPESAVDVEKTGKTETILGYKCQQLLVKDKDTVTELWLASDINASFMTPGGGNPFAGGGRGGPGSGGGTSKWEKALKGVSGFPLRISSKNADGKETFRMEATRVTPGPQPDSEFVPPADYQKFAMPNFGG